MMLSAYERRGEAKLFDDQEQIRSFVRSGKPVFSPSTGTSSLPGQISSTSPGVIEQTMVGDSTVLEIGGRIARATRGALGRRILPRFIPIVGWILLAKDIYDFATD